MKNHVHFIGIGGISQSALARILLSKNIKVSGSDTASSSITQSLKKDGATIYYNHSADNIKGANLVVYTPAIHEDNPEIIEAKRQGIKILNRAELLGKIAEGYSKVISVAGTHGKTTTTGMLTSIFIYAGKNPTVHIGGELPIIGGNLHIGGSEYFITEACEYCDSYLTLKSHASVVLNIQKDHMDYFKTMPRLISSFNAFANNTVDGGYVVTNFIDDNCRKLKCTKLVLPFGEGGVAEAINITKNSENCYTYTLKVCGVSMGQISLSVPGLHNVYNSLAATIVALKEGISIDIIKKALSCYTASRRRFQKLGVFGGVEVIHDYAHHPTEIAATISAAKKSGKLYVVFEPHTYSRTKYLWQEFLKCFKGAEVVILPPIYPAREEPIKNITSSHLARSLCKAGQSAVSVASLAEAYSKVTSLAKSGDAILLLGAGSIEKMCPMFLTG